MRTVRGHRHRVAHRLAARVAAAASLLLGLPSAGLAAPGEFLTPLRTGQFAPFDDVPAYHIRTYVQVLFATYQKLCPNAAPKYERPWDLAAYIVTPAHPARDPGAHLYSMTISARDAAMYARADGESDFRWLREQVGCAASAHQDWMTEAKKLLSDPRLAGPLPQPGKACEENRSTHDDCECFARSFDMQASPLKRRQFFEAPSPLRGLHRALTDSDFEARVSYKCATSPNFFRPELMARDPPHANQPDDNFRLAEGTYNVRPQKGAFHGIDRGRFTVTRMGNWRYELKWQKGAIVSMQIGILSDDGKEVTVYRGEPQPVVYRVLEDGKLRGLDARNQLDLVPAISDPVQLPGRRGPIAPQPRRRSDATPQQCARLQSDIERFRGDSRRAGNLAILERRYADWCAGR